jgi:class 3 adenylate cyclase
MAIVMDSTLMPSPSVVGLGAAQRRQVTALSIDVVGSMSLCSSLSDETWWTVIEELFGVLSEGVLRFGGWIENFAGDGLVAVFGEADDQPSHAVRACSASLWLREATDAFAADLKRERGVELSVRFGINSGDAVIGTLGAAAHPRIVAIGHAVGLAKRVETMAMPRTVYISQATAALAADQFELLDLGAFSVRGARGPMVLFELLGPAGCIGFPRAADGGAELVAA